MEHGNAPAAGQQSDNLHQRIMNLPCEPKYKQAELMLVYALGHRDARHAAAELVSATLPAAAACAEQDAKDAARYRWLRARPALSVFTGDRVRFRPFDCPHEIEVGQIGAVDLDDAIDAALSASCAPKQTEGDGNG